MSKFKRYKDPEMGKTNMCPWCREWFHPLGIANHRARCREKHLKSAALHQKAEGTA